MNNPFFQIRPLASVAVFLYSSALLATAEEGTGKAIVESSNPRIAQGVAILKRADDEALKAYALAKIKIRQRVIADLKDAQAAATRTNKLDDAVELRNKVDELELEMNDLVLATAPSVKPSESPGKKAIVGKWQLANDAHIYEFLSNGKFNSYSKNNLEGSGNWDLGDKWLVVACDNWVKWGPIKDGKWNMTCAIVAPENSSTLVFSPSKNGQATKSTDIDFHPFGTPAK